MGVVLKIVGFYAENGVFRAENDGPLAERGIDLGVKQAELGVRDYSAMLFNRTPSLFTTGLALKLGQMGVVMEGVGEVMKLEEQAEKTLGVEECVSLPPPQLELPARPQRLAPTCWRLILRPHIRGFAVRSIPTGPLI